jgi:predicted hotdog family 3-hydroxylacyl-ACP dehydratase
VSLAKHELCQLIPHAGAMCLLDYVEHWDETTISCTSRTHMVEDNPLRSNGRLHAACGVEYAAQAIAVHGSLLSGGASVFGYLVSLRDVRFGVQRIDDVGRQLEVQATRIAADSTGLIYGFRVRAGRNELLSGRAAVFLQQT